MQTIPRLPFRSLLCAVAVLACLLPVQCLAAGGDDAGPAPTIVQAPLPYALDALEPHISARTLEFHYGKHHAGYVAKANAMLQDSPHAGNSIEQILRDTAGTSEQGLFNNVAQAWNHAFFWRCLTPGGGGRPEGELLAAIESSFGSFETFREAFLAAAKGRFGSGWAWLVADGDKLIVISTVNADTPLAHGQVPLLTLDVWEHAYYLDYQNRRADFAQDVFDNLIDWQFVADNLAGSRQP